MKVLENDEDRSCRCRFEESKPKIIEQTEWFDLHSLRVQKMLHPAGVWPGFDTVDPREQIPNRRHRRRQRNIGLDVEALSARGDESELAGMLLQVGDQRRLADAGVPGNQDHLGPALTSERHGFMDLADLGLTANDLNGCTSAHEPLPRPIVFYRHPAVTTPQCGN